MRTSVEVANVDTDPESKPELKFLFPIYDFNVN